MGVSEGGSVFSSLPILPPFQKCLLCQARSQPDFSGKPRMISRDHFVSPVPSYFEMKEIG